jgi:hypothetical protein
MLGALDIPLPPRLRGRDLGPLLAGRRGEEPGHVYAETEDYALLGKGSLRLVCARRLGACQLFDVEKDPREQNGPRERAPDRTGTSSARVFGSSARRTGASSSGACAPKARAGRRRSAAVFRETARLHRGRRAARRRRRRRARKAGEVLFELERPETAPALRLALGREEDPEARAWDALGLTRLGEGAPLVTELLTGPDPRFRRSGRARARRSGRSAREGLLSNGGRTPRPVISSVRGRSSPCSASSR